jgi:hypothetical protein
MDLTKTTGYNETEYISGFEKLTLDDVIVTQKEPQFCLGRVSLSISIEVRPDLKETMLKTLNYEPLYYGSVFILRENILRGVRKPAQKAKIDETMAEIMSADHSEEIETELANMNALFGNSIANTNSTYINIQTDIYLGEQIAKDWIEENLDDAELNTEIDSVDEEISALNAKRAKLVKSRQMVRSQNMIKHIEKESAMPYIVTKDIIAKLENSEGFKEKRFGGIRI